MQPDLIPTLPKIDINKYDYEDEDFAITDFKKAERKIMMYENKECKNLQIRLGINTLNQSKQYDVCYDNRKLEHFYNSPIDNPNNLKLEN